MSIDLVILLAVNVTNLFLGISVLQRNPRARVNRMFAFVCFAIIFWATMNYLADHSSDVSATTIATRLTLLGGVLIAYSIITFSRVFPRHDALKRRFYNRIQPWLAVIVGGLAVTPLIVAESVPGPSGAVLEYGPAYALFIVYVLQGLIVFPVNFIQQARKATERHRKNQVAIVLVALFVYAISVVISNAIIPLLTDDWTSSRFGPLFSLVMVGMIAFAIAKHQLFDIRLALVRSITFILTLLVLAFSYYAMAFLVSITLFEGRADTGFSPIYAIFAIVLAFLFHPIWQFFDFITTRIFFRGQYKGEVFIAELSDLLASPMEFRGLLRRTSEKIASTFKAEQALFFLYYSNAIAHHLSAGTKGHSRLLIQDAHMLDAYVMRMKSTVIVTDLIEDENPDLWRMLVGHEVALVLPLRHAGEIIGYLMVGDHMTGSYTKRDLAVLKEISNELIIAIQNALLLHEEREVNAALKQQLENAQKEIEALSGRTK